MWQMSLENWVWLQGERCRGEILTLWTISPSSRGWKGLWHSVWDHYSHWLSNILKKAYHFWREKYSPVAMNGNMVEKNEAWCMGCIQWHTSVLVTHCPDDGKELNVPALVEGWNKISKCLFNYYLYMEWINTHTVILICL